MSDFFKKLTWEAVRAGAADLAWSYFGPSVVTLLTLGLGLLAGRPLDILFVMVLGAAVLSVIGLFHLNLWRNQKDPERNLSIIEPSIQAIGTDPTSRPLVTGMALGIGIRNSALFPMEIVVEDVRVRIEDRHPKKISRNKKLRIDERRPMNFRENEIDVSDLNKPGAILKGDFYIKLKFGRFGKIRYEKEFSYALALGCNERGEMVPIFQILDPREYLEGNTDVPWERVES